MNDLLAAVQRLTIVLLLVAILYKLDDIADALR